ncbi:MAG: SpoIIE family protein phosphatase [Flavobacteriales bacterium]
MIRNTLLTLLLTLTLATVSTAQRITIYGTVFSFKGEKLILMKKAQKNVSFDGSLEHARIDVQGENTALTITTGLSGFFSIKLENPGEYNVKVSRTGYSTIEFKLNYKDAGTKTRFEALFLILKQSDESKVNMGTLEIADGGILTYSRDNADNAKNDLFESNAHLIEKTVLINKAAGAGSYVASETKKNNVVVDNTPKKVIIRDTITIRQNKNNTQPHLFLMNELGSVNIDSLKNNLATAKSMLKGLSPESDEYRILKTQIEIAEQKIKDKQAIIDYKNAEIRQANKIILYVSLCAVAAVLAAFMLFYFFKQKKKYALLLTEKNKNIQRVNSKLMSSIRYASLIQTSFLQEKNKLKNLFSDSFVFNLPKDILSGDFYWFSHKNGNRVVVVADCTGHGVPGAMLTVLGHTMLEDIINVKGEAVPSKILMALNKAIQQTFAGNTDYIEYGMDITVISIKDNSNEVLLSGVGNGLYKVSDGKTTYYPVSPKSLGPDITEADLKDQKISVGKNDSLFMFTDGFADQFGNKPGLPEKFNISRFEKVLSEVGGNKTFSEAQNTVEKTLMQWKGDREQIDDICIVGVRV